MSEALQQTDQPTKENSASYSVLGTAGLCHMLNDTLQSLFVASYPIFKGNFHLSFSQIGALTLVFQITASLLQPLVGLYTDRKPKPYSLPFGMAISMSGLLVLAFAQHYSMLLLGGALLGVGSSIFHPESSRLARLASGGAHGMAQSIFQVGGNLGSSIGPLLIAFFVLPRGQHSLAWFSLAALFGITLLTGLGHWYKQHGHAIQKKHAKKSTLQLSRKQVGGALTVLILLTLSKYFYLASITSYYVFYLMQHFHTAQRNAQLYLFFFLAAVAAGTIIGGPVGDRIGRRKVIWVSILGVLPLTLLLPYASLPVTIALSILIGLILASAFSAILVYAQELLPGRVGMVSGLFFGLAFGLGGLGAAILGTLADHTSIDFVYKVCSFLPALGLLTGFLPDTRSFDTDSQAGSNTPVETIPRLGSDEQPA
ncbi:MFS transporter [Silvibacterium dinghuense]|uniref:MFS transporter n=1 Tax=Silvibacterium dinghuense TaxID=1560006 RepID=A0A4Q1SIT1_9BACT|nr:MFS transporter [Silvibacterium dinghuense]RXS97317.1 MFS transporter [Silvibacterium dinghuense]GGG98008.1 fosmidomycin resistance protein [Silvibacterium dinghuense]